MLFQRLRGNRRDFLPRGTALDQYATVVLLFANWCGLSVLTPCLLSLCAVSAWAPRQQRNDAIDATGHSQNTGLPICDLSEAHSHDVQLDNLAKESWRQ